MNLELECLLSFYQEVTSLDKKNKVILVKHVNTGELFVKKKLAGYCYPVYEQLKGVDVAGVPRVYEAFPDEDAIYVIEEYVHGRNLGQIYDDKGPFSEEDVKNIGLNLCTILTNIHDLTPPIIHRDIKPSNLILTSDGHLKLVDFDAAKIVNDDKGKDTHLLGTENFAAPEQYGFGASDRRTDIYGAGSTLNYLLSGKYPSDGICSGRFENVIKKCLEVDITSRYQNAQELYSALENPSSEIHTSIEDRILGDINPKTIGARRFLPVGFRTLDPTRMIFSVFLHLIAFYTMTDLKHSLWDNIIWCLPPVFTAAWFGNYLGMRSILNKISNKILRAIIVLIIWTVACMLILFFVPDA